MELIELPAPVKACRGRMMQADVRKRAALAEYRMWRDAGLRSLAATAMLSAWRNHRDYMAHRRALVRS